MNEMLPASKEPRVQQRDATERMQRPCDCNSRESSPTVTGDTEDQMTNSTLEMHTWAHWEAHQTSGLRKGDWTGEGRRSWRVCDGRGEGERRTAGGSCMVPQNWAKDWATNLKQVLQPDFDRPRASFGFRSLFSRPWAPVPELIMSKFEIFLWQKKSY